MLQRLKQMQRLKQIKNKIFAEIKTVEDIK